MENLKNVWQNICQQSEELGRVFYVSPVLVGTCGRSRLVVLIDNMNKEFGNGKSLRDLYLPEGKDARIRSTVGVMIDMESLTTSIRKKPEIYFSVEHDEGGDFFIVLRRYGGERVGGECKDEKEFEEKYVKAFDPGQIKSWSDIIRLFDL